MRRVGWMVPLAAACLVSGCAGAADDPADPGRTDEPAAASPAPTGDEARTQALELVTLVDEYGLQAEGPAWETTRDDVLDRLDDVTSPEQTWGPLAEAARIGGGPHSRIAMPGTPELDLGGVGFDDDDAGEGEETEGGPRIEYADGAGILRLEDFSSPQAPDAEIEALHEEIGAAPPTTCGWIVDLRENEDGAVAPMLRALAPLLPVGVAVGSHDRDGGDAGAYERGETTLTSPAPRAGLPEEPQESWPIPAPSAADVPVAVLQSRSTSGAGEVGVVALRGREATRSFGASTAGLTAGNVTLDAPGGTALILSVATLVDRDGQDYGQQPIRPQVRVDPDDADEAAREWLREQGCPAGEETSETPAPPESPAPTDPTPTATS